MFLPRRKGLIAASETGMWRPPCLQVEEDPELHPHRSTFPMAWHWIRVTEQDHRTFLLLLYPIRPTEGGGSGTGSRPTASAPSPFPSPPAPPPLPIVAFGARPKWITASWSPAFPLQGFRWAKAPRPFDCPTSALDRPGLFAVSGCDLASQLDETIHLEYWEISPISPGSC